MRNCPIGDEGPATRARRVHVFWDLTQRRTSIILFLLIAVPALTILSLSLDPFEGMDESEHFERSVQLSEGRIFPVRSPRGIGAGDYFEPRVTEFVHSYGRHNAEAAVGGRSGGAGIEEASQDGRKFAYFSNTVIYFPTAHAAPAIATYVLARAGRPPVAWFYAGRLVNAGLSVLIICVALAASERTRLFIFALALLPRTLFGAATLSADTLVIAFACLFAALISRLSDEGELGRLHTGLLIASTFFVAVSKLAYLPIVAVPPIVAFLASRGQARWRSGIAYASAGLLTALIWGWWAFSIRGQVFPIYFNAHVDINEQLNYVISNPAGFIVAVINALTGYGFAIFHNMIGGYYSVTGAYTPHWISIGNAAILLCATMLASRKLLFLPREAGVALLFCASPALTICLFLYLQFTPVGAGQVLGIQGRYFLPLLPLLTAYLPKQALPPRVVQVFSVATFAWLATSTACLVHMTRALG